MATARFEELDRRSTRMGEISLRRRLEPDLQVDVYEARLDDEFLMSSLFTVAEIELANALAAVAGDELDVVVGGLGLGHTARSVLDEPRVRSLQVVEALDEVIDWHRQVRPRSRAGNSSERTPRNVPLYRQPVASKHGPAEVVDSTTGANPGIALMSTSLDRDHGLVPCVSSNLACR